MPRCSDPPNGARPPKARLTLFDRFKRYSTPRAEPAQPVIRDPALARAVDLLKALAVLHKPRG